MGFNANQTEIIIESLVLPFVATLAVLARLYARRKVSRTWTIDDHFSIAAGLFYWAYNGVVVDAAVNGRTGVDPLDLPYNVLVIALKETLAAEILMVCTMTLARFSVVFLYYRLFSVDRRFALALKTVGGLSLAWFFAVICLGVFTCNPVEKQWNPLVDGTCMNLQTIFVVTESMNCALDLILVCLPIFLIQTLTIQTREKIGLCLIFLCGGFVCVASIVRIVNLYNPTDPAFAFTQSAFWTTLQLFFSILCACLPTYRPLFPALTTRFRSAFSSFGGRSRARSVRRSKGPSLADSGGMKRHWYGHHSKPSRDVQGDQIGLTDVEAGREHGFEAFSDGAIGGKHMVVIKHVTDGV